jgi:hypothetical protein
MEIMTENRQPTVLGVTIKTAIVHTVTYFLMGLIASTLIDYSTWYAKPPLSLYMRQFDDPLVMAGPMFQPIRGIIFGLVFYLLKDSLFGKNNGWLVLWALLVGVGILSPFGPAPASIEGMVYTVLPFNEHIRGYPEILLQSLLLSVITVYWVNHPEKRWISWVLGVLFGLIMLLLTMGLLLG